MNTYGNNVPPTVALGGTLPVTGGSYIYSGLSTMTQILLAATIVFTILMIVKIARRTWKATS